MKIRNKFLIPVIAILLAMLMVGGSVSGAAVDTSASEETSDTSTTHPLTYVPTTYPPTSDIQDEIDAIVSDNLGNLGQYGDDIRESNGIINRILTAFTKFIDAIINIFKNIGNKLPGANAG